MRACLIAFSISACASHRSPNPAPANPSTSDVASTRQSPPPPPNPNTTEPLVCNESEPCRSLPDELTTQCAKQNLTVKQGTCGALKVLVLETDPESVTFTSEKRYYDASDKLVATQMFVNEWGRNITRGTLANCAIQNPSPACPPK
jgi:hypothetical protein